ncbi:MAG TPA: prolyl oligopeptidase family serine peptidase [Planctomycetota bacterium]|nr:prolyl oligopeptidase family serine peptidase [Planctomycetota bacterium]
MRLSLTLVLTCIVALSCAAAETADKKDPMPAPLDPKARGFVKRSVVVDGATCLYHVFVPKAYDASKSWPVVVALHGAGEVGEDGNKQVSNGLANALRKQMDTFPAIVVFPQMRRWDKTDWIASMKLDYAIILKTLEQTQADFNTDKKRICLTGLSAGAARAWGVACHYPDRFSCLVPISGGWNNLMITGRENIDDATVSKKVTESLRNMPIWMFHGGADLRAHFNLARTIDAAFKEAKVPLKYTEYPNVGHSAWVQAYEDPKMWEWAFAQQKK